MAGVLEESEANVCIMCLGEDTEPIPPGCGHSICSSCLSSEPRPTSCCPECQDFYLLETQEDMVKHLEREPNVCIMCLGEDWEPIPSGCGHSICSSCLSSEPRPASCCPECQEFYLLDTQADMVKLLEREPNICIMCLGEDWDPFPTACGHSICSSCLRNEPPPASCCPECLDFYQLDVPADMDLQLEGEDLGECHGEQKVSRDNSDALFCDTCSEPEDDEDHPHWPIAMAAQHPSEKIHSDGEILGGVDN